MKAEFIEQLLANGYYAVFGPEERPVIVFRDHRFLVPVLWLARQTGMVREGTDMFRFDAHLDCAGLEEGRAAERFRQARDFSEVFGLARAVLSDRDDDWLALALEAGLVGRCVTVGPPDSAGGRYAGRSYTVPMLEGLLDSRRKPRPEAVPELWEAAGWPLAEPRMADTPVLLDIDCDYFSFRWRGGQNAWLDRFYEREFDKRPVDCGAGQARSPHWFMRSLIGRAPFVTVAVEPDFCGGEAEARGILGQLDRRFFNGVIDLSAIRL